MNHFQYFTKLKKIDDKYYIIVPKKVIEQVDLNEELVVKIAKKSEFEKEQKEILVKKVSIEKKIFDWFCKQPGDTISPNTISSNLGIEVPEAIIHLTMLEDDGKVKKTGKGMYKLNEDYMKNKT